MLPPTQFFGLLLIFAVITAGLSTSLPKELKDYECPSCFNKSDLIISENEDFHTRSRRSAVLERDLRSTMYVGQCIRIGTVGVGETYTLSVYNSHDNHGVSVDTPAIDKRKYHFSVMCTEDTQVEIESTYVDEDNEFIRKKFEFDCYFPERIMYTISTHRDFKIKNLGDGKSNTKIIVKMQETRNEQCTEVGIWKVEQYKKQKDPFVEKIQTFLAGVDIYDAVGRIMSFLASLVPVPGFSTVVDLFWSYMKPSEWDKRIEEVLVHIKNATIAQNLVLSKQRLESIKISIEDLKKIRQSNPSETDYYIHFINVYDKLLTSHVHFQFDDLETSLATLPLLTVTMSLIVQFFSLILTDPTYKMNEERMDRLRETRITVLENINNHILRVYDQQMTSAFNNCDELKIYGRTQIYIYDCIVDAHNLMAMQGLKFLSAWNKLSHFQSNDTRTIHVPIYSHFFGRPTTCLVTDIYLSQTKPLLTPPVYNLTGCYGQSPNPTCFFRKRVTSVNIVFDYDKDPQQISMIQVRHDGELLISKRSRYVVREFNTGVQSFDVPEGVFISKIRAGVDHRMRYVEFYMSDETKHSYGVGFNDKSIPQTTFELPDHHIADVLVKSDDEIYDWYGPVAYGIGVSYLPNPAKNY